MVPLAITSVGMVCPVGYNVQDACASLRAGIVRIDTIPFELLDEQSLEMEAVNGYPIQLLFDGFQGVARLARLASHALLDLLEYGQLDLQDRNFWEQTGLFLCCSPSLDEAGDIVDELVCEQLVDLVMEQSGMPFAPGYSEIVQLGNAGPLLALMKGSSLLEQGSIQRVIVVGVDSLIDQATVEQLADSGRLKTEQSPQGLIPGEAAAAVMVELTQAAELRNATADGYLVGVDQQLGKSFLDGERQEYGVALSKVMINVAKQLPAVSPESMMAVFSDLNGETARSVEWGHAVIHFKDKMGFFPSQPIYPAVCLGDTGAASAVVAICSAMQAYRRGYSSSSLQLVSALSDSGLAAAALLTNQLQFN